jgi:hypothetical protein
MFPLRSVTTGMPHTALAGTESAGYRPVVGRGCALIGDTSGRWRFGRDFEKGPRPPMGGGER